jgi:predicted transcriptional regulator
MLLQMLRDALDKTQVEVAEAANMSQGEVSRLEGQADFKLSTAQRYLAALGLELELAAVAKGRRFVLSITPPGIEADE